ncbi:hypothetical protein B5V89_14890 [Heyndrickxia sporothermodurans]|uniref:hypothetical protein n=1 Tax=Heyndrickxia sporothermodurans TaxID=46224 RepID=UPI000D3C3231|nr:hypothetical protein [Heyndrickxia sporothermodurans]PTY77364.1 hypothetical protein B5V89_14890 [Heyndrickxia sporothermodurans]
MNNAINAICDECEQEYLITGLETENIGEDIEKTFFTCPHCDKEYIAFYTDSEIRNLQTEIRSYQWQLGKVQTVKRRDRLLKQIEQTQAKNKEKMTALRHMIENQ